MVSIRFDAVPIVELGKVLHPDAGHVVVTPASAVLVNVGP